MGFGSIFGAIFFVLVAWTGFGFVTHPAFPAKLGGVMLGLLGLSLSLGLVSRRAWARWAGVGAAAALVAFSFWLFGERGTGIDLVLLVGSAATVVLLALPFTAGAAAPTPGPAPATPEAATQGTGTYLDGNDRLAPRPAGRLLPTLAAVATVGLLVSGGWVWFSQEEPRVAEVAKPAFLSDRVEWTDFGAGIDAARSAGKPILLSFDADWCGYCRKMDRETWKHPSVIERTADFVTVRVDIDDRREINGFVGAQVAGRYRVSGTPTTMVLDGEGQVVAQISGFLSPRQLLPWLDQSMTRMPRRSSSSSSP